MYTTCEAGKRRTVNHTRARARSPRRAGPGRAVAVAVAVAEAEARRGAARPDGRCGAVRRGAAWRGAM